MTQSALAIPNEAGASFRADNNTAHQANATSQSGASAPGTTYADQFWYDTTNQVLKKRNQANSGWIVVGTRDEAFIVSRASNTILGLSDFGKTFRATASFTQTLTAAATLGDGWFCYYRNDFTSAITIDPNASETIDGATTIALQPGEGCRIACNGTGFYTQGRSGQTVTVQTSGSGTYTTPLGAKKLRVRMVGGGGGGSGSTGGSAGGNGGDTTFSTATAGGGVAAAIGPATGGAGGVASGSGFAVGIAGSAGGSGGTNGTIVTGGNGGASALGGAGRGGWSSTVNATAGATNSGAGGGGGATSGTQAVGGGGGSGAYVEMHINSPAATYSYGVGAAGTAGSTGTSGSAAAAGGSGIIIIEEFY